MKIKQLEWSEVQQWYDGYEYITAEHLLGCVHIVFRAGRYTIEIGNAEITFMDVTNLDEAKAEAQKRFEGRVLKLLEDSDES